MAKRRRRQQYRRRRGNGIRLPFSRRTKNTLGAVLAGIGFLVFIALNIDATMVQGFMTLILLCGVLLLILGSVWAFVKIRTFIQIQKRLARKYDIYYDADLETLRKMEPYEFEQFVGLIFMGHGYLNVEVTKRSADGGIDIRMRKKGKRYAVQVKRYAQTNNVGRPEVQKFYGSFQGRDDYGILVTTSDYTREVRTEAHERRKLLQLLDGSDFLKYIRDADRTKWYQHIFNSAVHDDKPQPLYKKIEQTQARIPQRETTTSGQYQKFWKDQ